jgi:hypothetical protein
MKVRMRDRRLRLTSVRRAIFRAIFLAELVLAIGNLANKDRAPSLGDDAIAGDLKAARAPAKAPGHLIGGL